MSREAQQLARLLRQFAPLVRSRFSPRVVMSLALLLGVYLAAVPVVNRSLGWGLPGWSELFAHRRTTVPPPRDAPPRELPPRTAKRPASDQPPADQPAASLPPVRTSRTGSAVATDPRLAEILSGASRATFESPAGLRYGRGSQQGHRLRHVMAHTRDEPDRPGSHGVFFVQDPQQVVALIDEAFGLARRGEHTTTRQEDDRRVHTVDMRRVIGYVGGESGARSGHPEVRRIRLVLQGSDLITAFPVR